jgi:uncharacterized protein (TIGR02266 family)
MERREHDRAPFRFPVRFKIGDIDQFTEEHAIDLSEGGLFVNMNYPPPVGTSVTLTFYLEPVEKTITAQGKVVRSVRDPGGADTDRGMAIRFTNLGKDCQRFIELAVQKFNRLHPSQVIDVPEELLERLRKGSGASI